VCFQTVETGTLKTENDDLETGPYNRSLALLNLSRFVPGLAHGNPQHEQERERV